MLQGQSSYFLVCLQGHCLDAVAQLGLDSIACDAFLYRHCLDAVSYPISPSLCPCQTSHFPMTFPHDSHSSLHALTLLNPCSTTRVLSQYPQADIVLPRQFSTAPKRMKASTSNAATRGSDWRWHTTTSNDYQVIVLKEGSFETHESRRCENGQARSRWQWI